ncbi:transporter substrate-binding domain-containing protein [Bacillus piscicola]|uniref:transporter substrate-binding domain-containing protein n=1 Tax=Bacillus piscicola TaxID=1632684 RepID=UPI001F0917B0|nr:transporter substrate-binding domain-containing protein [Bacillus piscicola]
MLKRWVWLFCVLGWFAFPALLDAEQEAAKAHKEDVEEQERVWIAAYDPDLPPMHIEGEGKELTGFSVDVLNSVAERTGMTIKYVPLSKEESLAAIEANEIDMILSINFSERHDSVLDFSDSILSTAAGILVPADTDSIHGISDVASHTVAVQRNTVEYDFLQNIRRVKYQVTSNQVTALQVMDQGRADAVAGNVLTAEYFLKTHNREDNYIFVEEHMLPLEYSIGVGKEKYTLLNQLNRGIREMKSDGTYTELYEKWFGEEAGLAPEHLWTAIRIIGTLLVIAIIIILIWVRWNRQLQREVARKTSDLHDVNESLKEQMEQTKNSTEFQRQILNSSPRGIITMNEKGRISSMNPRAQDILGIKEHIEGQAFTSHPFLKKLLEEKFPIVLKGEGKQYLGLETTRMTTDNQLQYLRYYVYPLYDFTGSVTGIIFGLEDNTEEQMMRLQVFEQEKSQALVRVVAGIAHEIRNPLSSIKTFVELLPKKFQSMTFREKMTAFVPQEIDRLNQLIEGLIDYARPAKQQKEVIDVTRVLQDCALLFEATVEKKGFDLHVEWSENLYMKADADQLKQVIINLIINGIDAMEETNNRGLTLSMRAWQKEDLIHIVLEDEGPGIAEDAKQKAFEPFFTTKEKGTGLGLSVAYQYVKENNGQMAITGTNDGTTIHLTFQAA